MRSYTVHAKLDGAVRVEDEMRRRTKEAWPAAAPQVYAELERVSKVPEMVRLRVAASTPFQVTGEVTVEMGGSHSVEPEAIVMELTCVVLMGRLV